MYSNSVLLCFFICSFSVLQAASVSLEKTLNKFAGAALRKYPELRGNESFAEARARLVKSWESAEDIDEKTLKDLKRRKREYDSYSWKKLIERCELANLDNAESKFLLREASRTNLRAEEFYILKILLKERLDMIFEKREKISHERLREVGKTYSAFIRKHKVNPKKLGDFIFSDALYAIHPETDSKVEWCYVGAGPAEIRGANRYRMVAYSPFRVGTHKSKRWVVYKGGRTGEWQETSLQKKVAAMYLENLAIVREQERQEEQKLLAASSEKKAATKKALQIEIRELW